MKRWIDTVIIAALAAILVGCGSSQKKPWGTLTECEQENTNLSAQIRALESENTQLTEQVNTLSTLDTAARLEALDTLDKIRIGKRTGFYDKDDNGTNETLVVYLEPLDTAQDTVKAVGKVEIGLWDLSNPDDSFITLWEITPEILHTVWGGNIFNSYYRIELLPKNALNQEKEYTVKVTFADYLSGKTLTDQMVIQP